MLFRILLLFLNANLLLLLLLLGTYIIIYNTGRYIIIKPIEKYPMVTTIHLITIHISLVAVITVGTIYIYVCV